jgi:hypothetical protein
MVPFSDADPVEARVADGLTPPNVIRDTDPPSADGIDLAGDVERRCRPRRLHPNREQQQSPHDDPDET